MGAMPKSKSKASKRKAAHRPRRKPAEGEARPTSIRCTPEEFADIDARAEAAHMSRAAWIRLAVTAALRGKLSV